jgi:hypothetical protein
MSQRAHFWIRLVAVAVIVAVSFLPRVDRHDAPRSAEVAHNR